MPQDLPEIEKPRHFTVFCRVICIALIAATLAYFGFVVDGDAYHFLALVVLAPIAGLILMANSLSCMFRERNLQSFGTAIVFMLVGFMGFFVAWYFLSQFRM
jgi:hypothetical protein